MESFARATARPTAHVVVGGRTDRGGERRNHNADHLGVGRRRGVVEKVGTTLPAGIRTQPAPSASHTNSREHNTGDNRRWSPNLRAASRADCRGTFEGS